MYLAICAVTLLRLTADQSGVLAPPNEVEVYEVVEFSVVMSSFNVQLSPQNEC